MKRKMRLVLTLIGICLLWVAASSEAGPLLGFSRVVDITFVKEDGTPYCDGIHMTLNPQTGKVIANRTGCDEGPLFGTVGSLMDSNYRGGAVILMDPVQWDEMVVILDNPKVWIYYANDGSVKNEGKYSVGPPAMEVQGTPCSNCK